MRQTKHGTYDNSLSGEGPADYEKNDKVPASPPITFCIGTEI